MFPHAAFPSVQFPNVLFPGAAAGGAPAAVDFDLALSSFLSAALGATFRPLYTPQKASFPAWTYALTSRRRTHTLRGSSGTTTSVYQITAWSQDYATAAAMALSLFQALDSYAGAMGTAHVFAALSTEESVLYNPPLNDSARGVHQRVCAYEIVHTEPISGPTAARA